MPHTDLYETVGRPIDVIVIVQLIDFRIFANDGEVAGLMTPPTLFTGSRAMVT